MNIAVRRKDGKDGMENLFLDYYLPKAIKKRKKESLRLSIYKNPKTSKEREFNKKTLLLAESVRSDKLLKLQHQTNGFGHLVIDENEIDFIEYFKEATDKRYESKGNYGNWDSTYKHLVNYANGPVKFRQIDPQWVEGFKEYLMNAKSKSNKSLSANTKHSYFNKLKACLNQAQKEGLIKYDAFKGVKGIKAEETEIEFLTMEELKRVTKVDCEIPVIKTAFLFSCLTGLRWSDVNKLIWDEIQYSEELGFYIRFKQKKTKDFQTLPISREARELIGDEKDGKERVFVGLKYSAWHNLRLQQWMMTAGIPRKITFHCGRHTYATLQLTMGTDLYTLSKLLGHKDIKTTQIYAKVIDQKKVLAAHKIPSIYE